MIRVGFVMQADERWIGGVNYYRNLIGAVTALPGRRIEPVLFIPDTLPAKVTADFRGVEIVRHRYFAPGPGRGLFGKLAKRTFGRLALQEFVLRRHRVAVHSHAVALGPRARLPTIAWVPDFQHVHLPAFFPDAERRHRDSSFAAICRFADVIVVSSEAARRDLAAFAPHAAHKARTLRFVAGLAGEKQPTPVEVLVARYGIDRPYFHLPNQFWGHKNHRLAIEAAALLKARGRPPLILATGQTEDFRAPGFFGELQREIAERGLADSFRILGLVAYADLLGLMRNAVAVINPSHFEGWSTTVEEAKSEGKRVLLSDIPVHREQAPARASYFDAGSPEALAELMDKALAEYSPIAEAGFRHEASAALPARFTAFAREYEAIALAAAAAR